ncbi:MAG: LysM peptidoglycan-binding domain-containing protein [Proteobacteria bacterium]|nr:LysM peptidoglycan-binding domain-containing protein [Pseudomonadota bacterium]
MGIHKTYLNYILIAICSIVLLGACAPQQTGDLDRDHRSKNTAYRVPSHESWDKYSSLPEPSIDGYLEGRLQGDVEPEPEQTKEQELQDLQRLGTWEQGEPAEESIVDEVQYDFPITVNKQVQYYLDFFAGKHRQNFEKWLSRSSRYLPMIQEHLREAGLPEDLAYLAMIESGYNERAYSRARAVGIWQFIKPTGRHYGLAINSYVDERRDPIKSTRAAAAYLSALYEEFGSWYLAVAGYNAGEGKIRRAIKRYKTTDFWEIAQGRYLKLETKRYVPKLIAAIMISREPEKYGFTNVQYQPELAYDTVEVPRWTSVKAVALACNMDSKELRSYNNELRKEFTPPDRASYPIKVPAGKKELVEKNLPRVQAVVTTDYKTHKVKNGETLNSICKKYGLTKTVILKSNNLRSAGLKSGQRLRIPYQTASYKMLPEGSVAKGYLAAESSGGNFVLHKIQPGETVSELARLYNVPIHLIAAWNDIRDISRITAGQQLVFYVQLNTPQVAQSTSSPKPARQLVAAAVKERKDTPVAKKSPAVQLAAVTHSIETGNSQDYYIVQQGDSLWNIARNFGLTSRQLSRMNGLAGDVIYPGDRLVVKGDGKSAGQEIYYQVRNGDSLWDIALQHAVTPEEIRSWNNLKGNMIHPGNRLLLKMANVNGPKVETYYRVRSGDSLWTIARKHNTSPEEIKRWNNLKNNTIHPGSRLLIKVASDIDV